jgi:single-strand DNA-binding protein
MSFNKTILMGNLTRDPEAKSFPSGTTLTSFGLAVNETWTDKTSGEKKEDVCFIDVDAWGRQGEVIMEYFSKGKPILVEGRIRYRTWEADDGSKRSKHSVNLERFSFVGSKNDSNGSSSSDDGELDQVPF